MPKHSTRTYVPVIIAASITCTGANGCVLARELRQTASRARCRYGNEYEMEEKDSISLPPRGIFVPTQLIYSRDITGTVLRTWIQLRGLAWKTGKTPPITIDQLSEILGKSPSAIYSHVDILKGSGALRWRTLGDGRIIVTFDPADSNVGG